jgi:hypothetical protein
MERWEEPLKRKRPPTEAASVLTGPGLAAPPAEADQFWSHDPFRVLEA